MFEIRCQFAKQDKLPDQECLTRRLELVRQGTVTRILSRGLGLECPNSANLIIDELKG